MIDIFKTFSQKKSDQIKYTLVLWDIIKQKLAEEKFVVDSARPTYPTSDDYLADICLVVEKNL